MKDLFSDSPPVSKQQWLEQIAKDLKGSDLDNLITEVEEIKIQPFYTKEDLPEVEPITEEEEDFEIGTDAENQLAWSGCEEIEFTENDNAQKIFEYALSNSISWLRISSYTDNYLHQLGKAYPVPVTISINPNTDLSDEDAVKNWKNHLPNLASYESLLWGIEFDPINYWMKNGKTKNPATSFNNLAEIYLRLSPRLHSCRFIKVDVTGANFSCTQQLSQALNICSEYFDALSERDIPVDELMNNIVFRFPIGSDFFLEIAKLRAFKVLWENFIKAWLPEHDFIMPPSIHCVTILTDYSKEDKYNNLIRTTTEAMSAIIGGCEVLSILPFDNSQTELSKRLARNIHHILRYESYLDKNAKAANGSFYLESLAHQLAEKSWEMFKEIESKGGIMKSIRPLVSTQMES